MKKQWKQGVVALAAACMVLLSGCSDSRTVLRVYNWADYMSPEVLRAFEKQFHCRVVVDTFDSNEAMYAKLKAGAVGYDLLFPTSYMAAVMQEQGMLQPLRHELLPNLEQIDRDYLAHTLDPDMVYSVPYMISVTGIGYNQQRLGELPPTWSMFSLPAVAGRSVLLNDMRETIGAALKMLGYSLNTVDDLELELAQGVLIEWKRNIAKFDVSEAKRGLASGEFLLVHSYNGDILQAMDENEDLDFMIPAEGTSIAGDDMVIPVGARQVELAHAFINFLHDPRNNADSMEYVYYLSPNTGGQALVSDEFRQNEAVFIPADVMERCEVIRDLGADNSKYIRVWDAVKASTP